MYDEDFYYEPSEFDQQIDEFKQSILGAVKDEYKAEMERLRKENHELQEVKTNFEIIKKDYKNKERKLELERKELGRKMRRERLSALMKDFEVVMYRATSEKAKLPKCELCDEKRKIRYKTPLGKDAYEDCVCSRGKTIYVPEEMHCSEFRIDRDGNSMLMWYKIHQQSDYEYASHSSSELAKEIYHEGMKYEDIKSHYYTYFSTKEQCQNYCDWLTEQES